MVAIKMANLCGQLEPEPKSVYSYLKLNTLIVNILQEYRIKVGKNCGCSMANPWLICSTPRITSLLFFHPKLSLSRTHRKSLNQPTFSHCLLQVFHYRYMDFYNAFFQRNNQVYCYIYIYAILAFFNKLLILLLHHEQRKFTRRAFCNC